MHEKMYGERDREIERGLGWREREEDWYDKWGGCPASVAHVTGAQD